jgi:HK97 family phage prohead protease
MRTQEAAEEQLLHAGEDDANASPPRDDLIRMVPKIELREEGGRPVLFGHFAVFNEWTEIDSWEGKFMERIAPGAFRKTFKENRDYIQVLFNHGFDPQIGDKPLGLPEILREDAVGAYAETPLADTSYNRDIAELTRAKALRGQSFRFRVVKEAWDHDEEGGKLPERTIKEVRLFEFGPVTFPAYQATTIGVRSRESFALWQGLSEAQRDEIERMLRQSATLERTLAKAGTEPREALGIRTALIRSKIRFELKRRKLA